MSLLDKFKRLFQASSKSTQSKNPAHTQKSNAADYDENDEQLDDALWDNFRNFLDAQHTLKTTDTPHLHPITTLISLWLDEQQFKYEHRKPNRSQNQALASVHHLIMRFSDDAIDWTCVFRINEYNQLVSLFGVLPDTVPQSHFAPMLVQIAKANLNIGFGSIELDPNDGEVRAKLSFDAEFTTINERSLFTYLQGLAGLTELAQKLYDDVLGDDDISSDVRQYLPDEVDDEPSSDYFTPTERAQ
ncbi:hypothetical protein B0181_01315 [Moraxella caviae]|uniref:Bacterial sensory transduction regulator n=1 Tax=Moraxella caviae TaxID=34060 RepID=A0A1T0ABV5_9GAMM|nr:hypothetical protein [Moraxella caviae]OOR92801.1 hypothetical protein B0181_01315 [Moraxella caviae]STZ14161.1 Uncharacterised protein [Moraxella caviae]VEW12607.1 Uncharacterised protein [Moraxella caviae]